MRVLVVEDEVRLAEAIAEILKEQRYAVDVVHDGMDGLDYALSDQYDVVILDVMIPKLDGFQVVRQLRDSGNSTPVIMLTAKDEVSDKIQGLDSGADDYMTKPFVPEELLARVRAMTRRQGEVQTEKIEYCDLFLNLSTNTLHCGSKSIHLGFKEFEVLKILMNNTKVITPKEDLIVKVWGMDSDAEDNNVEAYISFLRKKIIYLGSEVSIETTRKVGYKLQGTKRE